MRRLSLCFFLLLLTACENIEPPQLDQGLRRQLFFQCLAALPKGPDHTKYNDWSEVVSECGTQAYYMSMKLKKDA